MRISILALAVGLAACSGAESETNLAGSETTAEVAPASGAAIAPGLYEVGDETTAYGRTRLNADGTYVDLDGETEVARGTWRSEGAQMCFDPEGDGEDEQERCWTNEPAAQDGSFISTRDDGSQSYRVTPISE